MVALMQGDFFTPPGIKAEIKKYWLAGFRSMKAGFFASMLLLVVVVMRFFSQNPVFYGPVFDGSDMLRLNPQVQEPQPIESQPIEARLQKEKRIDRLLVGAERAFSNANYILPEGRSAHAYYQQVLKLQADNLLAQDGLKNIENELLDLARFAYFGRQYEQSLNYLEQLKKINPDSSAVKLLYSRLESAQQENVKISAWLVEAENYIKNNRFTASLDTASLDTASLDTASLDNKVYDIYKKILSRQPDNKQVLRKIENIKQHYFKNHISVTRLNSEEPDMRIMKKISAPVSALVSASGVNKNKKKVLLVKKNHRIKKKTMNKPVPINMYKKLSIEQASQKIAQFKMALQAGDKKGLKRISQYVAGREQFVDTLLGQYKKINVAISDFKLIAGKNKAQVNIALNNLVDINDKNVVPGSWSQFETTISYNRKNQLKIIW